jgi:UDP-glucose 6-dehydrogenase
VSTNEKPAIGIFGAGWVGLVTGACFADLGHRVVVRDVVPERIETLRAGEMPFHEPGLAEIVKRNGERLTFTLDAEELTGSADIFFACVDTPPTASGDADLSSVWSVIDDMGDPGESTLVMKSTVPVGTGERIRAELDKRGLQRVAYVSNPEFLAEGTAVRDFMGPDRIVIGAFVEEHGDRVEGLYESFDAPIVRASVPSAEMVKLAANAFLATRISFINEIANVSEAVGADVEEVAKGVGLDHRLGPHFLRAGIGYGGSCLLPDERVVGLVGDEVAIGAFHDLWTWLGGNEDVEVLHPSGLRTISWSEGRSQTELAEVSAVTRRWFDGDAVEIEAGSGYQVRCTADHPVLVRTGSRGATEVRLAGELVEGDFVPTADGGLGRTPPLEWREKLGESSPSGTAVATRLVVLEKQARHINLPGVTWRAITNVRSETFTGSVYSFEVPGSETFLAGQIVVHNCFPKDVSFLKLLAGNSGYHFQLVNAVIEVNELQKRRVVQKLKDHLGSLRGKTIALLGLAFKPDTDDMREAPSLVLAARLQAEGAEVRGWDALVSGHPELNGVAIQKSVLDAVRDADAAVIVTEWSELKELPSAEVREAMRNPLIVDGRNLLDPAAVRAAGFEYEGIGRS